MVIRIQNRKWLKGCALLISLVFSLNPVEPVCAIAGQDPGAGSNLAMVNAVKKLNSEWGKIDKINAQSGRKPLVVHIQDAHANPSAQKNIAEILGFLFQKDPGLVVAVEGARGRLRPDFLDLFPAFPEVNEAMVQDMAAKGELSGAELFAWKNYRGKLNGPFLTGIEDAAAYQENLKTYQHLLALRPRVMRDLDEIRDWIVTHESRILSGELKEFLKERDRRKQGRFEGQPSSGSDLSVYSAYLARQAKRQLQIDLSDPVEQLRFPYLFRILQWQSLDKSFQRERLPGEWKKFLQTLRGQSSKDWENAMIQSLDLFIRKSGLMQPGSEAQTADAQDISYLRGLLDKLGRFLDAKKISADDYPNIFAAFRIYVYSGEMDVSRLWEEMNQLENGITRSMVTSEEERLWVRRHELFENLMNVMRLELTHAELKEVRGSITELRQLLTEALDGKAKDLDSDFESALKFYETALMRDRLLADHALTEVASHADARLLVIITGGFHTEGIRQILEQRGMAYVSIQPSIPALDSGKNYEEVMSGKYADLSTYFQGQAVAGSMRQALLLRSVLEVAVPVLRDRYKLSSGQILSELEKTLRASPVLSDMVEVRLKGSDQAMRLEFSPKVRGPERFTVAAPQVTSEEDLSAGSGTLSGSFSLGLEMNGNPVIEYHRAPAETSMGVDVRSGVLTPDLLSRARNEVRAKKAKEPAPSPEQVLRASLPGQLDQLLSSIAKNKDIPDDSAREQFKSAAEKARAWFQEENFAEAALVLQQLHLAYRSRIANSMMRDILGLARQFESLTPGVKAVQEFILQGSEQELQPQQRLESLQQLMQDYYPSVSWQDVVRSIQSMSQAELGYQLRYIWGASPEPLYEALDYAIRHERLEIFMKELLNLERGNQLDIMRSDSIDVSKLRNADIRARLFGHFAMLAATQARSETRRGGEESVLRSVIPTSDLIGVLTSPGLKTAPSFSRNMLPAQVLPPQADMKTVREVAARIGVGASEQSGKAAVLFSRMQEMLGPYGYLMNPKAPAVHVVIPEASKSQLQNYQSIFLIGMQNPKNRVTIIAPVSKEEALVYQNTFSSEALKLGLPQDFVRVVSATSKVQALRLIPAISKNPRYAGLSGGVLLTDRTRDMEEEMGIVSQVARMSGRSLDTSVALLSAASLLRDQPDIAYGIEFYPLMAWLQSKGVNVEDLSARLSDMIRVIQAVASAA